MQLFFGISLVGAVIAGRVFSHYCTGKLLMPGVFKRCPLCLKEWNTEEEFLQDRSLLINGYQFAGRQTTPPFPDGYILFTHSVQGCGTTLAVIAKVFKEVDRKKETRPLFSPM